jgi:hypothetical protein
MLLVRKRPAEDILDTFHNKCSIKKRTININQTSVIKKCLLKEQVILGFSTKKKIEHVTEDDKICCPKCCETTRHLVNELSSVKITISTLLDQLYSLNRELRQRNGIQSSDDYFA